MCFIVIFLKICSNLYVGLEFFNKVWLNELENIVGRFLIKCWVVCGINFLIVFICKYIKNWFFELCWFCFWFNWWNVLLIILLNKLLWVVLFYFCIIWL